MQGLHCRWDLLLGSAFFPSFLFLLAASFFICKTRVRQNLGKIPNSSVAGGLRSWLKQSKEEKAKIWASMALCWGGKWSLNRLWKHGMSWEVDYAGFGKHDWSDWELFHFIKCCDWLTSLLAELSWLKILWCRFILLAWDQSNQFLWPLQRLPKCTARGTSHIRWQLTIFITVSQIVCTSLTIWWQWYA